jgi:hypothetical protein
VQAAELRGVSLQAAAALADLNPAAHACHHPPRQFRHAEGASTRNRNELNAENFAAGHTQE